MEREHMFVYPGKISSDIQVRDLPSKGGAFETFTVCNFTFDYVTGARQKPKTNTISCKAFNARAKALAASLVKGSEVMLYGEVEQETWTSKEGQPRNKHTILVDKAELRHDIDLTGIVGERPF